MFYFYKLKLEAPDLNGVVTLSLPTYNPNIITTQEKGDTKKIPSVRKVKFPVCSKEWATKPINLKSNIMKRKGPWNINWKYVEEILVLTISLGNSWNIP